MVQNGVHQAGLVVELGAPTTNSLIQSLCSRNLVG